MTPFAAGTPFTRNFVIVASVNVCSSQVAVSEVPTTPTVTACGPSCVNTVWKLDPLPVVAVPSGADHMYGGWPPVTENDVGEPVWPKGFETQRSGAIWSIATVSVVASRATGVSA